MVNGLRHKVRLGPRRYAFFCPFTRLHLTYPDHPEGEVDDSADLTYILAAIRSGSLVDVNGTLTARGNPPAGVVAEGQTVSESLREQGRLGDDGLPAEPRGEELLEDASDVSADAEPSAESEPEGQDPSGRSARRRRRR